MLSKNMQEKPTTICTSGRWFCYFIITSALLIMPSVIYAQDVASMEGVKPKFPVIYFDYDQSVVKMTEQHKVEVVAHFMQINETVQLLITGHTDERGPKEYNFALGERLASVVKKYLIEQHGVQITRLHTVSYGEERPVVFEHNQKAWYQNRRVEFTILDE